MPTDLADFPEMVERKGAGHPDSIADECAEASSRALSHYYLEHFGRFFHHNVDKAAYVGGCAQPKFGGGDIIDPQNFTIIGRAIDAIIIEGKLVRLPVGPICRKACYDVFRKTFRNMDLENHVVIDYAVRHGSVDLTGVFNEEQGGAEQIPLANDTSFGVGFAPFSDCELITLKTEHLLNSDEFKAKCPGSGEDIKVMSHRVGNDVNITICNAMVSRHLPDASAYLNAIDIIKESVRDLAAKLIPNRNVTVTVNSADIPEHDIFFLTITGTSAEAGDDGQVGRGNRANGLITPGRVQTLEAAAGKNPVNHVGKLYSLTANRAARRIVEELQGDVVECQIRLLSQIGKPINKPWLGDVEILPADNVNYENVSKKAIDILQAELDDYVGMRNRILKGEETVW
jgi:S-adenosylmethionine synthetase